MPIVKGNLSVAIEDYIWKWPDPTASELRRFIERDFGKYLVNALRDVGVTLGIITFKDFWGPPSVWLSQARKVATIPEKIGKKLLHIDNVRIVASHAFPSLDRAELDAVRTDIVNVMAWLRTEFPAAGVERLPGDFGR